jgi:MFS family permease
MNRHFRWNMTVNVLDVAFFIAAMNALSVTIVLPAFMVRLGASPLLVALLPAIQIVAFRVPQVVVPYFIEGRSRLMPWVSVIGLLHRLPWLLVAAATYLIGADRPDVVLGLAVGIVFVVNLLSGLAYPAWAELVAKVIPSSRWGMCMGVSHMLGNGLGILVGFAVAYLLRSPHFPYPANYAAILLLGAILLLVSFGFYQLNREPVYPERIPQGGWRAYVGGLFAIMRGDASFRWFVVYQCMSLSGLMGVGLFMVYGIHEFSLPESRTGEFVVAATLATLVASPLLGVLGDRRGHRLVLAVSTAAYVIAAVLAIFVKHWTVMYPVFALTAIHISAQMIAFRNMVYELAPEGRRPSYVALASLVPAPAAVLFPVLAGWLVQHTVWGYAAPFGLSAAISVGAWIVLETRVRMRTGPVHGVPEREG